MIIVEIKINTQVITRVYAHNISNDHGLEYGKGEQIYHAVNFLNGNEGIIKHKFEDGAEKLSKKLIDFSKRKCLLSDADMILYLHKKTTGDIK